MQVRFGQVFVDPSVGAARKVELDKLAQELKPAFDWLENHRVKVSIAQEKNSKGKDSDQLTLSAQTPTISESETIRNDATPAQILGQALRVAMFVQTAVLHEQQVRIHLAKSSTFPHRGR